LIILPSLWIVGLLCGTLLMIAQLVFFASSRDREILDYMTHGLTEYIGYLATIVGCLAAVGAAIHSAGAFASERDRQTFDNLLATPLLNRDIVWDKWWGGFLSVRKAWYCLIVIWAVGVFTRQIDPYSIPVLLFACPIYAAVGTSVGLWFSLVCRTTLRAMFWTVFVLGFAFGGHLVIWWIIEMRHPFFQPLIEVQEYGLTPPVTLYYLGSTTNGRKLPQCIFGLAIFAA